MTETLRRILTGVWDAIISIGRRSLGRVRGDEHPAESTKPYPIPGPAAAAHDAEVARLREMTDIYTFDPLRMTPAMKDIIDRAMSGGRVDRPR